MNDIFAEMEADALDVSAVPSDSKLKGVAALAEQQVMLEQTIDAAEEHLKDLKKDLRTLSMTTLPDALMELGLSGVPLADGTLIEMKAFVAASISKDNEAEAFTWLRDNDYGDLIKTITSIDTGKDEDATSSLQELLASSNIDFSTKPSVHAGTLKAWVKEQTNAGVPIPQKLFGVYLGQKTTIKRGT